MIGARFWVYCRRPGKALLMSPHDQRGWKPGVDEVDGRPWLPIDMESRSGIYAAKDMQHLQLALMTPEARDCMRKIWWESPLHEYGPQALVFGQVRMWGKVIEHEHGFRAENARICSLDWISHGPKFMTLLSGGPDLEILRLMYGVACVQ